MQQLSIDPGSVEALVSQFSTLILVAFTAIAAVLLLQFVWRMLVLLTKAFLYAGGAALVAFVALNIYPEAARVLHPSYWEALAEDVLWSAKAELSKLEVSLQVQQPEEGPAAAVQPRFAANARQAKHPVKIVVQKPR